MHWTKDGVLKEDGYDLLDSQAAANSGVIRDIVLNLLVMAGYQSISEGMSAMGEKVSVLWDVLRGTCIKSHG